MRSVRSMHTPKSVVCGGTWRWCRVQGRPGITDESWTTARERSGFQRAAYRYHLLLQALDNLVLADDVRFQEVQACKMCHHQRQLTSLASDGLRLWVSTMRRLGRAFYQNVAPTGDELVYLCCVLLYGAAHVTGHVVEGWERGWHQGRAWQGAYCCGCPGSSWWRRRGNGGRMRAGTGCCNTTAVTRDGSASRRGRATAHVLHLRPRGRRKHTGHVSRTALKP